MNSNNSSSNPTANPPNNPDEDLSNNATNPFASAVNSLLSFITPFSAVNNDPTATPAVDPANQHPISNVDPTVNINTPAQPTNPQPQQPHHQRGKGPRNSSRSKDPSPSPSSSSFSNLNNNHHNNPVPRPTGPATVKGDAVQIEAEITRIPAFGSIPSPSSSTTTTSSSSSTSTVPTKKMEPSSIDNNAINVLVTVTAPDVEASKKLERAPLNLLCVLDRSGSMSGENKMKSLIETMQFVLDHVTSVDTVSVISFNDQGFTEVPLRLMNDNNRTMAKDRVAALRAGGGTCISNGLTTAFMDFDNQKHVTANNSVTAVLLLTDGQDSTSFRRNLPVSLMVPSKGNPNDGPELDSSDPYASVLLLARNINAPVHCFGFGADHDARVLNHIASKSNGTFTYIENIEQVGDAFASTLGSLTSTITKDMVLRVWVPRPSRRVQPLGRSTVNVDNDPAPDDNDMMNEENGNNNPDDPMDNNANNDAIWSCPMCRNRNDSTVTVCDSCGIDKPDANADPMVIARILGALRNDPMHNYRKSKRIRSHRRKSKDSDDDDTNSSIRIVKEMDPQDQFTDVNEKVTVVSSTTTTVENNNSTANVPMDTGSSSSSSSSSSLSSSTDYPIVGGTLISNVRTAYRSILKADGSELIIHFGALSAGEKRQILLTLRFPDIILEDNESINSTNGIRTLDHFALQAMGHYVTLADNQNCSSPLGKLIVTRIYGSNSQDVQKHVTEAAKSVEVEAACLRDISTKSMKRALKAADHGDYNRARTTLSTAIEQLTHSPAYTNGNALVRGLTDDLTHLQARVSNSRAMEAGGRAAVLSSVSSHMMQKSTGTATPGMMSSAVYSSRMQTEMMMLSPTKNMARHHTNPVNDNSKNNSTTVYNNNWDTTNSNNSWRRPNRNTTSSSRSTSRDHRSTSPTNNNHSSNGRPVSPINATHLQQASSQQGTNYSPPKPPTHPTTTTGNKDNNNGTTDTSNDGGWIQAGKPPRPNRK